MERRTIELYLADGTFNGIVGAKLNEFPGRMTKIDRFQVDQRFEGREEILPELQKLQRPGVYFLLGKNIKGMDAVYVGQSDDVYERINKHIKDYDGGRKSFFWSTAFAFTRKGLTTSELLYLEAQLFDLIHKYSQYECMTTSVNHNEIDVYKESDLHIVIESIKKLLKAVGCNVFGEISTIKEEYTTLYCKDENGTDARGYYYRDQFVVLQGSKISNGVQDSLKGGNLDLRKRLEGDCSIIVDGYFVKDYPFNAINPAAHVVCGRSVSGKQIWKTKKGVSVENGEKFIVKKNKTFQELENRLLV